MLKPPKVAAYISLPELGQPKPTLRDVVQIAKTINRSAGLTVLGQMNLFLGAASIKQDLEKDADARWKAQEHLIRTTVSDLRLKILKAKLFKALLRDRVVFHRSQLLAAIKLVALFGEPARGNMLAARDDFGVLTVPVTASKQRCFAKDSVTRVPIPPPPLVWSLPTRHW